MTSAKRMICCACRIELLPASGDFCDRCQRVEDARGLLVRGLVELRESRLINGTRLVAEAEILLRSLR